MQFKSFFFVKISRFCRFWIKPLKPLFEGLKTFFLFYVNSTVILKLFKQKKKFLKVRAGLKSSKVLSLWKLCFFLLKGSTWPSKHRRCSWDLKKTSWNRIRFSTCQKCIISFCLFFLSNSNISILKKDCKKLTFITSRRFHKKILGYLQSSFWVKKCSYFTLKSATHFNKHEMKISSNFHKRWLFKMLESLAFWFNPFLLT